MIRGIFTAASGMIAEMERQDAIANNLANVDTAGFKRDNTVTRSFGDILLKAISKQGVKNIGPAGIGVEAVGRYVDLSDGVITDTDNPCDLAIEGTGFFVVQGNNGPRYTRAGNFSLDKDGYLVNKEGYRVLGKNGPIQLKGSFTVSPTGMVNQGGRNVDELLVVNPDEILREGEYLFTATSTKPATGYRVVQGAIERSNVNGIREMLQMINVSRSYETNQKALSTQDETLGKAVNDLAR